ncbi:MAG TPA: ribosome biogenesis factor YjgA [Gammaproteobacteria bacterium]|nr:ribosome biogenesis factor YjgA [Gammaproteobacteria bacterium]
MNVNDRHEHENEPPEEGRGRSRRKRAAEALQRLGEELLALSDDELARVPLPEALRAAVTEARRIHSREALRRQRQYVGRLMRELGDPDTIRAALERLRGTDRAAVARLHAAERWRERLIAEGDAALGELLARWPTADRGQLRRLAREAARERAQGLPPRHARLLYQAVHALLEGPAGSAENDGTAEIPPQDA